MARRAGPAATTRPRAGVRIVVLLLPADSQGANGVCKKVGELVGCREKEISSILAHPFRPDSESPPVFGRLLPSRVGRQNRRLLWEIIEPTPDYWKLAAAFGGHGERVSTPESLEPAIQRGLAAMASGQFAVLDVLVTP